MRVLTEFRSIYRHGFARVAACTTRCTLADPVANVQITASGIAHVIDRALASLRTRLASDRRPD